MVVLPADPVIPTMVSSGSRSTSARASLASAAGTSGTMIVGWPVPRVPSTTTAPLLTAWAAKSCPSARSPGSAANIPPGAASLESITTGPVTTASRSATSSGVPPVIAAICPIVNGITPVPLGPSPASAALPGATDRSRESPPPPRPRPRGHRTG